MDVINSYSLEEFAERHRADFDLHEPRPELWEALTAQLAPEASPTASQPRMSIVSEAAALKSEMPQAQAAVVRPLLRTQTGRWKYFGVALALTLLVVAAGLGEAWKTQRPAALAAGPTTSTYPSASADAALYARPAAAVLAASQGGPNGNARLDTAVHGMERYYAAQLTDRQAQLSQLVPDTEADWAHELVSLDSSYQQLKRELPRHPQPEVVLTAMNRNLQIRLDILDRQLELRGADQVALRPAGSPGSEYALADSRSVADNAVPPHAH